MGNAIAPGVGMDKEEFFDHKKIISIFFKEYRRALIRSTLKFDSERAIRLSATHSTDLAPLYGGSSDDAFPKYVIPSSAERRADESDILVDAFVLSGDITRVESIAFVEYTVVFYVLHPKRTFVKSVKKRYRQIEHINSILISNYPEMDDGKFPSKKLFGNLSTQLIESRISGFNAWLGNIMRHPDILTLNDCMLLKFFEVEDLFSVLGGEADPEYASKLHVGPFKRAIFHTISESRPEYLLPYPITCFKAVVKRITLDIVNKELTPKIARTMIESKTFPNKSLKEYQLQLDEFTESFTSEVLTRLAHTSDISKDDIVNEIVEIENFEADTVEFWKRVAHSVGPQQSLLVSEQHQMQTPAKVDRLDINDTPDTQDSPDAQVQRLEPLEPLESMEPEKEDEVTKYLSFCRSASYVLLEYWIGIYRRLLGMVHGYFDELRLAHKKLTILRQEDVKAANEEYEKKCEEIISKMEKDIHSLAIETIQGIQEKENQKFNLFASNDSTPFFMIRSIVMLCFDLLFVFISILRQAHAEMCKLREELEEVAAERRKRAKNKKGDQVLGFPTEIYIALLARKLEGLVSFAYERKKSFLVNIESSQLSFDLRHTFALQLDDMISNILSEVFVNTKSALYIRNSEPSDSDYIIHEETADELLKMEDIPVIMERLKLELYRNLLKICSKRLYCLGKFIYFESVVRLYKVICSNLILKSVKAASKTRENDRRVAATSAMLNTSLVEDIFRIHLRVYVSHFEEMFNQ